jgi:hypothetical protein
VNHPTPILWRVPLHVPGAVDATAARLEAAGCLCGRGVETCIVYVLSDDPLLARLAAGPGAAPARPVDPTRHIRPIEAAVML